MPGMFGESPFGFCFSGPSLSGSWERHEEGIAFSTIPIRDNRPEYSEMAGEQSDVLLAHLSQQPLRTFNIGEKENNRALGQIWGQGFR